MSCKCKCSGASSSKGSKGDQGESAYQIALDNGFEGTEAEWLASLVAACLLEIGSGANSLQTKDNGANASGADSEAFGVNAISSGAQSYSFGKGASSTKASAIAIGNGANSDGVTAISFGDGAAAEGDGSIAIGAGANAIGDNTNSIGNSAVANIDDTTNISGCIITRKDLGEGNPQLNFAGAQVTITTEEIDLKATAGGFVVNIPTGASFYLDEVDLIITNASSVSVQPFIRIGTTGVVAKFLAIIQTTGLTTTFNRQRFQTLLSNDGTTSLRAEVTTAATASTMKGRFIFRGILIENE